MSVALVLEKKNELNIRDIELNDKELGDDDVRIAIRRVGVCGSDVHYYTHGRIGPYVVNNPMVLGHEASGVITDVGSNVRNLSIGDRVCMEPGVPNMTSRASKLGIYNVDPDVSFWATPPVHGCLTKSVIHPASFTFKLPDNVSLEEGAMVEPFATGMQASTKAQIKPGDIALVTGAGTIGIMTAQAALASGCANVFISDVVENKLALASQFHGITTINAAKEDVATKIFEQTGSDWGADIVFECSGAAPVYKTVLEAVRPGGCVVFIGLPVDPIPFDLVAAVAKEIRMETVFRYANIFDRAINLIASGKVDLKPLLSATYDFKDGIAAFERAAESRPDDVKIQIKFGE